MHAVKPDYGESKLINLPLNARKDCVSWHGSRRSGRARNTRNTRTKDACLKICLPEESDLLRNVSRLGICSSLPPLRAAAILDSPTSVPLGVEPDAPEEGRQEAVPQKLVSAKVARAQPMTPALPEPGALQLPQWGSSQSKPPAFAVPVCPAPAPRLSGGASKPPPPNAAVSTPDSLGIPAGPGAPYSVAPPHTPAAPFAPRSVAPPHTPAEPFAPRSVAPPHTPAAPFAPRSVAPPHTPAAPFAPCSVAPPQTPAIPRRSVAPPQTPAKPSGNAKAIPPPKTPATTKRTPTPAKKNEKRSRSTDETPSQHLPTSQPEVSRPKTPIRENPADTAVPQTPAMPPTEDAEVAQTNTERAFAPQTPAAIAGRQPSRQVAQERRHAPQTPAELARSAEGVPAPMTPAAILGRQGQTPQDGNHAEIAEHPGSTGWLRRFSHLFVGI